MRNIYYSLTLTVLIMASCTEKKLSIYEAGNDKILYAGLVEMLDTEVVLIGSASLATFRFAGDTCVLLLRNNNPENLHNYFSLELNGEDLGRFKIEGDSIMKIPVPILFKRDVHQLTVYKSTEAANGYINVCGIECSELLDPAPLYSYSIEFIGNSITCGMGNDLSQIPCGEGLWYDQHNAYWAYGPTVSRALKVNYLLSSVSGIGIYRNWNSPGPTMPEVYSNLYLNPDVLVKRDFSAFVPDIVSICLGTNDFSGGDGVNERLPFDSNEFTEKYIGFVQTILNNYPETQIALLSSPMVGGELNTLFIGCLQKVKKHFEGSIYKPFAIFEFENIVPGGCDYHPDIDDHLEMAKQLHPFYKGLLDNLAAK